MLLYLNGSVETSLVSGLACDNVAGNSASATSEEEKLGGGEKDFIALPGK